MDKISKIHSVSDGEKCYRENINQGRKIRNVGTSEFSVLN